MAIYTPYFYIIQDKSNGIYYAGARWAKSCHPSELLTENGYTTSSVVINELISIHGLKRFFIRKIRYFSNKEDVLDYETRFLKKVNARNNDKFYNKSNNEGYLEREEAIFLKYGVKNYTQTNEFRDKRKATSLEKYGVEYPSQSPEVKAIIANTHLEKYGETHYNKTEKARKNLSEKNQYKEIGFFTGKKHTKEAKEKIGLSSRNRAVSEETRKKLSEINKDKTVTEDTRQKISLTMKKRVEEGDSIFLKISSVDIRGNCIFVERDVFYAEKQKPERERLYVGITSREGKRRRGFV